MVTAEDVGRSFRGMAGLLNREPDAIGAFDLSLDGFARSFWAIALTAPAFIVSLALQRRALGLDGAHRSLFDDGSVALAVGLGHLASFLALPLAMMFVARRLSLGERYVPFVVATNWVAIFGSFILAVPGALYLMGLETRALMTLFTIGFAIIVLHAQWFAAKVTLRVGAGLAAGVTALGVVLHLAVGAVVQSLAV